MDNCSSLSPSLPPGSVTSSSSASQMASGISLVSFNSRPDGMHQRSYSVSSADQWSEATVIANSGISTGMHTPPLSHSQSWSRAAATLTESERPAALLHRQMSQWNYGLLSDTDKALQSAIDVTHSGTDDRSRSPLCFTRRQPCSNVAVQSLRSRSQLGYSGPETQ